MKFIIFIPKIGKMAIVLSQMIRVHGSSEVRVLYVHCFKEKRTIVFGIPSPGSKSGNMRADDTLKLHAKLYQEKYWVKMTKFLISLELRNLSKC